MQLRTARLCADCEEIHQDQQCPVCGSEAFAFLSRWVPVEERRGRRRPPPVATVTPEKSSLGRWVKVGTIGLAAVAVGRWFWSSSAPAPRATVPSNGGPGRENPPDDTLRSAERSASAR